MIEFNPDGSLKLPERLAQAHEENKEKLTKQRCIRIRREIVSDTAPKKCILKITLSEAINDDRFIDTIYKEFKSNASVPSKLTKIGERLFDVEIGTDFRRCTDCNSLINKYREFFDGNIIENKGSCPFEGRSKSFCYEDHFS